MSHTFLQKLMLMIIAGFLAAGVLYVYRHVVHQAIWETSDEGYRESLRNKPKRH